MFIFIVLIAALIVLMIIAGVKFNQNLSSTKTYGIPLKERNEFSWPALEILKEYQALPESNRPVSDIIHMVRALDVKHDAQEATNHFATRSRSRYDDYDVGVGWNQHTCIGDRCNFWDYVAIHRGIKQVSEALVEQQHALSLAGVESGLSGAKELAARLREERDIIKNVTKEMA